MAAKVHNIQLNNGLEIPLVGLGTYSRNAEPGQFRQAVEWALEAGYRHIDTASVYRSEEEVGEGINNIISKGLITRDQVFVTTKLWNDKHAREDVIPTLKESLKKLKLDYVDLYLIHWPVSTNAKGEDSEIDIDLNETWKAMEEAQKLGLTKSIGVSNFNKEQLEKILEKATITPAVNQIEINPTLIQTEIVDFCKKHSVLPVAYTPLGLISDARPEFHGKDVIKTDPAFGELANKYGKSRAQIALRYLTQRGIVVLPKSFTKSRIEENLNIFDFELTEDEMKFVESFNINHRCVPGKQFTQLKNYPF